MISMSFQVYTHSCEPSYAPGAPSSCIPSHLPELDPGRVLPALEEEAILAQCVCIVLVHYCCASHSVVSRETSGINP